MEGTRDARQTEKPEAGGPGGGGAARGAERARAGGGTRGPRGQRSGRRGDSEELGAGGAGGRGGCRSPFMNSQAPRSSPDSAAILSEMRAGQGWVAGGRGHPPPGAGPLPRSRGARGPEHRVRPRQAAGAEGGGGSGVSAPGAPGTFRGGAEPAPRGAHTPPAGAAPTGTRLPPPPPRRRAWEAQSRAESPPGSQRGHGGAAVRPRSRPWSSRGRGQDSGARAGSAARLLPRRLLPAATLPPPAPRPGPAPDRPPARPRPSALGPRGHPLKGQRRAPVARRPRVTWSRLLGLCCRPPIAGRERGPRPAAARCCLQTRNL